MAVASHARLSAEICKLAERHSPYVAVLSPYRQYRDCGIPQNSTTRSIRYQACPWSGELYGYGSTDPETLAYVDISNVGQPCIGCNTLFTSCSVTWA